MQGWFLRESQISFKNKMENSGENQQKSRKNQTFRDFLDFGNQYFWKSENLTFSKTFIAESIQAFYFHSTYDSSLSLFFLFHQFSFIFIDLHWIPLEAVQTIDAFDFLVERGIIVRVYLKTWEEIWTCGFFKSWMCCLLSEKYFSGHRTHNSRFLN